MDIISKLQKNFHANILDKTNTSIIKSISNNQIEPEERIAIYRNTITENLRNTLALTFPAIWKLLGEQCANSVARAFIQDKKNLPRTGCLDDWGGMFPNYLYYFKPLENLIYLRDVAYIEWLKHKSYCAKDTRIFSPAALQKYDQNDLLKLRFIFNPSVFFHQSTFSLMKIFDLLEDNDSKNTIELQNDVNYAIIARYQYQVQVFWVDAELFAFLQLLAHRETLENAFIAQNANFDLSAALQFILNYNLIQRVDCL